MNIKPRVRARGLMVIASLAACGGEVSSAPSPGEQYAVIELVPTLCLSAPLPTDDTGMTTCHLLVMRPNEPCDNALGLTPATAVDVDAVRTALAQDGLAMSGPLCTATQLDAQCPDESAIGWCYSPSSCEPGVGEPCAQSVCGSSGFSESVVGAYVYLACP